jgi:hypothetical protein
LLLKNTTSETKKTVKRRANISIIRATLSWSVLTAGTSQSDLKKEQKKRKEGEALEEIKFIKEKNQCLDYHVKP